MKHKSMSEMNREREFKKAQKEADEDTDYRGGKAYYKFLELFYKNKQSGKTSTPVSSTTQDNKKEKA
jgi:hypothetical protein